MIEPPLVDLYAGHTEGHGGGWTGCRSHMGKIGIGRHPTKGFWMVLVYFNFFQVELGGLPMNQHPYSSVLGGDVLDEFLVGTCLFVKSGKA